MTETAKATITPTCREMVRIDSWHDARCTRAIKDEGLCGIHLAAKRKRAENTVKATQKFEAENARHKAAQTACEKIAGSMPHYGAYSKDGYDGRIVVPASIAYEYDALKAVEAAARTVGDKFDIYVTCLLADTLEDRPASPPTDHAHIEVSEAVDELLTALAALDAIRKPSNGKTGEAKL